VSNSKILIIDDDSVQSKQLFNKLSVSYQVEVLEDTANAVEKAASGGYDLIMVSTLLTDADGLRLATQMKNREELRGVPILTLVDEDDDRIMLKGLEIGINDYLRVPVDKNEMEARVKTNIRRKKYQEALKNTYQQSISMAITDGLTGLYNRHYLNTHLENLFNQAIANKRPLTLLILDMDHFKIVNDTYGHDVGDLCLKQLAKLMLDEARSSDLVARYGGEEFVILLPETDVTPIGDVADRLRRKIEAMPFIINPATGESIQKTVSIGVAGIKLNGLEDGRQDTPADLLKRADTALYKAKTTGRNQVIIAE
jgi:two-component system cell cycle response regulator